MQYNWMELLYEIFKTAIIPLLGVSVTFLVFYIKTKIQELKEKTKDKTQEKYLDMLSDFVTNAVITTNQVYVNSLKEQGSFDSEAQKNAFEMTKQAVLSLITDDMRKVIEEVVGDLETYVNNLIESSVYTNKLSLY